MKVNRWPFSFAFLFILLTALFVYTFRRSSEEKLNIFVKLKDSELPLVVINTDAQKLITSKEDYRRCDAYFIENFGEALSDTDTPEKLFTNSHRARIRGRGNSTWTSFLTHKHSYLLKLDDEMGALGLPSAKKWILQANLSDKTSLRNAYAYHIGQTIFQKAGWAPKTQFVHLVINGKFLGLYLLMEKAEVVPHRIELPFEANDSSFLAEVNSRLNRAWNFISNQGVTFSIREKENAPTDYYQNSEKILQDFENVLFSEQFQDQTSGYRAYIDFDSFVDWYIVNEFTKNHDACFQDSCFMYYSSTDKKIHMGPIWDFDIACGNNTDECADPTGLFIQSRHWFKRLWEDAYFREKVCERWKECRTNIAESFDWIETQARFLETGANLDDKIWQRFGYYQWPNPPGYKERKTYRAEIDYMVSWLKTRASWLDTEWKVKN